MILRNNKLLFWQYVDWSKVIKHIESLKSRIYKIFIKKTYVKNDELYSSFINSSIVNLFILKKSLNEMGLEFNEFELGYLLFCFSNAITIDIVFFYYYRNKKNNQFFKRFQLLVHRIHYLLIISSLKSYTSFLKNASSALFLKICEINKLRFTIAKNKSYKYYLFLDLKRYLSSLSLMVLLNRVFLPKFIFTFVSEFFHLGYFDQLMPFFLCDENYYFRKRSQLLRAIIKIFILHLHYDLSIILDYCFKSQYSLNKKIVLYDNDFLLFLCHDNHELLNLKRKIREILSLPDALLSIKDQDSFSAFTLEKGPLSNLFFISIKSKVYPFCLVIRPSLKYQFILMKQISSILSQSKSRPFFLLNIRLNMLILSWINIFIKYGLNKTFLLLDYLIALKVSKSYRSYFYHRHIYLRFSEKIFYNYQINNILHRTYFDLPTNLQNKRYYKFYCRVRLLWLSKLKY